MPHVWILGDRSAQRREAAADTGLPELLPAVDAHRRLRGPYTAGGTVLRALMPAMLEARPDLVHRHDVEVLSAAPELRTVVPASRETLTSLALPQERTRFYSRLRTRRIAHGLTELLRDYLAGGPQRMLVVDNANHADPTDAELLAIMLRRLDPALLTVVVAAGPEPPIGGELADALSKHARRRTAQRPAGTRPTPPAGDGTEADAREPSTDEALAEAYVETECTSDDPGLAAAYERLDPASRARLHDARAGELAARDELSLAHGAIPFHRERGSDPAGAGAEALRAGLDYCIDMGFYDATVDFGHRGRAVVDWSRQEKLWWVFTTKMTTSLAALSRPAEAEALYVEARQSTTNPRIHQQAAYATSMLYTRHHEPELIDHSKALAWINESVAIASLLPEPDERAFNTAFAQNGRALVQVHLGDLDEALRLVDGAIALLDAELDPDTHRLHRSVLLYNRAQVMAGMRRLDDALADYTAVITIDPNYAEYYLDRGNILRRLGREEEALADYDTAIRLSPPFPEVYYNRADVLLSAGQTSEGMAVLDYVLELDPDYVDAYVNRAGARLALGDEAGARADVDTGLALDPDNAHLLCVLGQLHADADERGPARDAYDRALVADPGLQAAWAGRGALAYQAGDAEAAVADFDRALDIGDDASVRYNRAVAYEALGRFTEALADLDAAADLDPADPDIPEQRARLFALGGATPL
jgi:tetratricopeptide (TPR) repeat protein